MSGMTIVIGILTSLTTGEEEVGQFYTASGKWNDLPGQSTDTTTQMLTL